MTRLEELLEELKEKNLRLEVAGKELLELVSSLPLNRGWPKYVEGFIPVRVDVRFEGGTSLEWFTPDELLEAIISGLEKKIADVNSDITSKQEAIRLLQEAGVARNEASQPKLWRIWRQFGKGEDTPVLRVTADDAGGDFGPDAIIGDPRQPDSMITAASLVAGWASQPGRTEAELAGARSFLQLWPAGPQL